MMMLSEFKYSMGIFSFFLHFLLSDIMANPEIPDKDWYSIKKRKEGPLLLKLL